MRPHPRTKGMVLQPNGKWAYPPEFRAKVLALYAQYGAKPVARAYRLSHQTVINFARAAGMAVRTTQENQPCP